ncbi:MAG: tetratricopeptide repeat protein, partial [Bacteroidota bacterium]
MKKLVSIHRVFRRATFFLLLLLASQSAYSQKGAALPYAAIKDSISANKLTDLPKAKYWADRYFEKARNENNLKEESKAWENTISLAFFEKNISKAALQVENYFSWAKACGNKEVLASAYLMRGSSKMAESDLKAALENFYKCLEIAKTISGSDIKEYALSTISSILEITGDHLKASEIRHEMLTYFTDKKIDSTYTKELKSSRIIYVNAALAISYRKRNLLDSVKICEENMKKLLQFVDSCTQSVYYLTKAERAYSEKRYNDSKDLFKKTHGLCPAEYPLTQLNYDYQIGKSELGLKNYAEAISILQGGIDSYKVQPEEEGYMDDYYKLLANAYKETGQLEKANFYFEKYIVSSSEFSKLKSEASQAIREKEMREFNLELKQLEEEKKEQKKLLNLILIFGTILI